MALRSKSLKKKDNVSPSQAVSRSLAGADATNVFVALLEAERWLFAAGRVAGADTDPKVVAAIGDIRRRVCQQLEKLQPRAYRAFDNGAVRPPLSPLL